MELYIFCPTLNDIRMNQADTAISQLDWDIICVKGVRSELGKAEHEVPCLAKK